MIQSFDLSIYYNDLDFEKLKKFFPDIDARIQMLSQIQNYKYKNKKIAALALIHRSSLVYWPQDKTGIFSNEKFEYLGDSFLNFFVAGYSMSLLPSLSEGELSKLRAVIVAAENLAQKSRLLNIGACLMFGKTEKNVSFSNQDNILADAFEAVTAALLLDAGPTVTLEWLKLHFTHDILSSAKNLEHLDAKGRLQNWTQNTLGIVPEYRAFDISKDPNNPLFEVSLYINGREISRASGKSKKMASKKVAEIALTLIKNGALK